ncbi:unnamed protein product [Malus baccata var. baccata]
MCDVTRKIHRILCINKVKVRPKEKSRLREKEVSRILLKICMSIAASVSYTNTIRYILQEVRFTEPELFKHMMSQFIAEFSSATISYLQSEEELSRLYARLTPMMPNEAELMCFGKILENNMTVGQCKLPLVGIGWGIVVILYNGLFVIVDEEMDPVSSSNPDFSSVDGAAVVEGKYNNNNNNKAFSH